MGVHQEAPPVEAREQAGIEDRIASWLTESDPEFKEATPDPEGRDTKPPAQAAAPEEEPAEPEETPEEVEAEAGEEEEGEPVEGEPEEQPIETMSDLAQAWEMEEDELLKELKVKAPDGNLVPLADVVQSYGQTGETPETKEFREKLEVERGTEKQAHDAQMQSLKEATDRLLTQMEGEEKLTDEQWKELETEDPVEWNRRKIKEQERATAVGNSLRQMEMLEAKREQEWNAEREQIFAREISSLKSKSGKFGLPDWNKEDEGKAAMDLIMNQLTDEAIGLTRQDVMGVEDHRFMQVAYYAAKYLETQKQGQKNVSRVRDSKLPKYKSGAARRDTSSDGAIKKREAIRRRLAKTGSEKDAALLIEEML